eukprot:2371596-Rhodomonas_salina.1
MVRGGQTHVALAPCKRGSKSEKEEEPLSERAGERASARRGHSEEREGVIKVMGGGPGVLSAQRFAMNRRVVGRSCASQPPAPGAWPHPHPPTHPPCPLLTHRQRLGGSLPPGPASSP